jgi:hypothetical protein
VKQNKQQFKASWKEQKIVLKSVPEHVDVFGMSGIETPIGVALVSSIGNRTSRTWTSNWNGYNGLTIGMSLDKAIVE